MPNPIPRPAPTQPQTRQRIPAPPTRAANPPARPAPPSKKRRKRTKSRRMMPLLMTGAVLLTLATCAAVMLGAGVVLSAGRVAPNVSALGVDLGWKTEDQAADALRSAGETLTLRDGERVWTMRADEIGIALDADATAAQAADVSVFAALAPVTIPPVASVNTDVLREALTDIAPQVELAAANAGFRLANGTVEPVPPVIGRVLDVEATVAAAGANPSAVLQDDAFDLVMSEVQPAVMDAAPLVAQAQTLLASPLTINAWNPFTDDTTTRQIPPEQWAPWLTAGAGGTRLAVSAEPVAAFVAAELNPSLAAHERVDADEAAAAVSAAVANLNAAATVRVYEGERTHTVQSGETITSIAWDYGIPYPYIQRANPAVDALSAGQQLTIPSREVFLPHDPVPGKRIVVSISGNWTKVYENGSLKWDWVSSTGINSSPTWTGVYQIISHEENAYAGNWNLNMPWFMGVYQPIPDSTFTNGFHGFPTRGGGQLLWENSLGTKVTYGCILLSNTNAKLLYDWAEDGVMVELLP